MATNGHILRMHINKEIEVYFYDGEMKVGILKSDNGKKFSLETEGEILKLKMKDIQSIRPTDWKAQDIILGWSR